MSDTLSRTPLFALHVELGGRIVPFAGWEMPVQYTGIIEEHMAVRNTAGLFDVSHMGEARVRGRDAAKFLDGIMTNEMATIKVGMARYTVMCQPDGGCVDDLIVYRLAEEEFLICLNASNAPKDIAWMRAHIGTRVRRLGPARPPRPAGRKDPPVGHVHATRLNQALRLRARRSRRRPGLHHLPHGLYGLAGLRTLPARRLRRKGCPRTPRRR